MKTAVVILNWNGLPMLRRFLPALVAHTQEPGTQIVVADNGSTDASLSWLTQEVPSVHVIPLGRNYGFAEGYNKALSHLEADYFVLLNSDVLVPQGWLTPLLAYMDTHPDVAACQPKLLSHANPECFEYAGAAGGFVDKLGYPYCRGRIFATVEADSGQYDQPLACLWASGACLLIRSSDYREAGGLDARFFAHQEEIDLCWRLSARGRKVACVPASSVYHVGGGTLDARSPRKTYLNFRNNLLLLYKNMPSHRLVPALAARLPLDALASLTFMLSGQWRSAFAVPRAWASFASKHRSFAPQRRDNLAKAVSDPLVGTPSSILWQYHALRRLTRLALRPPHDSRP